MNHVPHPIEAPGRLHFGLLGPVLAERAGEEIALGGVKQRGLLAALVFRAGQVVTTGQLIEDVWGDDAPGSAPQMVKVFVSRLRAALGDPAAIRTGKGGYRIDAGCAQIDVLQARSINEEVRSGGRPAPQRAALCADALALWRGEALADLAGLPLVHAAAPELVELRRSLLDARAAALLESGRYEDVLLESRTAIAQRPLDDAAHGYLMHALYLAGRQAEALSVYADYHARLVDELGVVPGPDLAELHGRVLRHDPTLRPASGRPRRLAVGPGEALGRPETGQDAQPAVGAIAGPSDRRRHWRRWAMAGGALVLSGAAVAGLALANSSGPGRAPSESGIEVHTDSVAEFDGNSGTIVADTPVGGLPGSIAVDGGYAWTASDTQHTVTAISETTDKVATTYGLPTAPRSLTPGAGVLWIGLGFDGRLARILISTRELTSPFFPDRPVRGLVAAAARGTALWVATADGRLAQLDGRSLQVKTTVQLGAPARALVLSRDAAWTIDSGRTTLRRTSLRDRSKELVPLAGDVRAIGAGLGSIWVLTTSPNQLLRLTDTGQIQHRYAVPGSATSLCVGSRELWAAVASTGLLVRLDPAGVRPAASFQLGHPIGGIACDGERVWISLD